MERDTAPAAGLTHRSIRFSPTLLRRFKVAGLSAAESARRRIDREFVAFANIEPHLVPAISILGIGAGLGMMDVLIARTCGARSVHLIEGDGNAGFRQMGYHEGKNAWFDREITRTFCTDNLPGVEVAVHSDDPGQTIPADIITSFKSWGHHYPIETYLPLAQRSLSYDGIMIVDLRKGQGGLAILKAGGFGRSLKIDETPKLERYLIGRG